MIKRGQISDSECIAKFVDTWQQLRKMLYKIQVQYSYIADSE